MVSVHLPDGKYSVYLADGPAQGQTMTVSVIKNKCHIAIPKDNLYKCAVYFVTKRLTVDGYYIAILSHCLKR